MIAVWPKVPTGGWASYQSRSEEHREKRPAVFKRGGGGGGNDYRRSRGEENGGLLRANRGEVDVTGFPVARA